jgi:endonuclease/exonuclease/phosphatase family metal-dependent hydrolase
MGYEYTGNVSAYRQQDGKGNIDNELYNLLFWDPDKFELVEDGHFWLTRNGRWVAGSADKSRMCTWAILRNKDTGFETLYASTHFVTGGNLEGANEQLNKTMGEILTATLTEKAAGRPIVVGGDYNMNEESPSYEYITGEGGFTDAKYKGKTRLNITMTSFRSWGKNKSYASSGNPIDHIFFKGDLVIEKWQIMPDTVNDTTGKVTTNTGGSNYDISDHLGVYVKIREPEAK